MSRITAQVAAEAILNAPHAYELATIVAVLGDARALGVAAMYVDMLAEVLDERMRIEGH